MSERACFSTRRFARLGAGGFVTLSYLLAFGFAAAVSVAILLSPNLSSPATTAASDYPAQAVTYVLFAVVPLAAAHGATRSTFVGPGALREWLVGRHGVRGGGLRSTGWVLLASLLGSVMYSLLSPDAPRAVADISLDTTPWWFVAVRCLHAGIAEELYVVALPIVVVSRLVEPGRFTRTLWWFLPLLVIMRLIYHVHYGWGVLSLLPWAVVTVLVYIQYRRVWPLIVLHACYDFYISLADRGFAPSGWGLFVVGFATAMGLLLMGFAADGFAKTRHY